MEKLKREYVQQYVWDFWDTMAKDEQALAISEGFLPPHRCEIIVVDFINGLGEIARYVA